jgi:hypothetical protein
MHEDPCPTLSQKKRASKPTSKHPRPLGKDPAQRGVREKIHVLRKVSKEG